ncbi:DMT family transporter [Ilumatobacter sp.]|uniref:DMT family transporter n=1 Tax=Ilumatobacter sp. TaxID=1967498 RepID=UPI003AF6D180
MLDGRERGWALAAVGMLLVSTDSYFIRRADFDAWTIAFLFAVASTISLGLVFAVRTDTSATTLVRREPWPFVAIVVLSALTQLAFVGAVNNTAVANVVVIVAATPIVSAGLAWALLGERVERRIAISIAATVAGIVVVVGGSVGSPTLDGDLLALVAVALVSASLILWRRHRLVDRPLALAMSSASLALITAPFASVGEAPARVFVAAGLMGLLFNPLGRIAYTTAPKYAPTAEVALFTPIETVAATVWAWMFFSERPTPPTVVGGVIVIAAVVWGTVGARARNPRRSARC